MEPTQNIPTFITSDDKIMLYVLLLTLSSAMDTSINLGMLTENRKVEIMTPLAQQALNSMISGHNLPVIGNTLITMLQTDPSADETLDYINRNFHAFKAEAIDGYRQLYLSGMRTLIGSN